MRNEPHPIARGTGWGRIFSTAVCLIAVGLLISPGRAVSAEDSNGAKEKTAQIEVDGLGWFKDRQQAQSLKRLLGAERGETLDVNAIEDAVFLLLSSLTEEGYLEPTVKIETVGPDGTETKFTFDATLESSLPRSLVAQRVRLEVERGVRFVFGDVRFTGLAALEEEAAREFFVGEPVLLSRKGGANLFPRTPAQRREFSGERITAAGLQ